MALKAGTIANFSDSMAEAIENAFLEEWPEAMGGADKPETNPQMKLLFVAVAQGVVRYLKDYAGDSILVEVSVKSTNHKGTGDVTILTSGTLY